MEIFKKQIPEKILVIIIAIVTASVSAGGTWYLQEQKVKKVKEETSASNANTQTVKKAEEKVEKKEETKFEIPKDFKTVKVNGVEFSYPSKWGEGSESKSKEDFSDPTAIRPSYAGSEFTIKDNEYFYIYDLESYKKDSSEYTKKQVNFILNAYKNKSVANLHSIDDAFLPSINAAIDYYDYNYIENYNSDWRGFWYIANISQETNLYPNFVAFLINEKTGKTFSLAFDVTSKKITEVKKEIEEDYKSGNGDAENIIESYIKQYNEDKELMSLVENEYIKVLKSLK